jgi:hypothetical protein
VLLEFIHMTALTTIMCTTIFQADQPPLLQMLLLAMPRLLLALLPALLVV